MNETKGTEKPTVGIKEIRDIQVGESRAFALKDYRHGNAIRHNVYYYNQTEGREKGEKVTASVQYDNGVAVISKERSK